MMQACLSCGTMLLSFVDQDQHLDGSIPLVTLNAVRGTTAFEVNAPPVHCFDVVNDVRDDAARPSSHEPFDNLCNGTTQLLRALQNIHTLSHRTCSLRWAF